MRTRYAWLIAFLFACTKAGPTQDSEAIPAEPAVTNAGAKFAQPPPPPPPAPPTPVTTPTPPTPPPPPVPPPAVAKVTIQMTAATLADDCGGSASLSEPDDESNRDEAKSVKSKAKSAQFAKADRSCDQSSMQLSIKASAVGTATKVTVKKVELFDDKGVKIGTLKPRAPTKWTKDGMYKAWDQMIAPGQELSVSYELSQPPWGSVADRRNRTYVLKAVVTVGGDDRTVKRDVYISAPTSLPPGVKT